MPKMRYREDIHNLTAPERERVKLEIKQLTRWKMGIDSQIQNLKSQLDMGIMLHPIIIGDDSVSNEFMEKDDYVKGTTPSGKIIYVPIRNLQP